MPNGNDALTTGVKLADKKSHITAMLFGVGIGALTSVFVVVAVALAGISSS